MPRIMKMPRKKRVARIEEELVKALNAQGITGADLAKRIEMPRGFPDNAKEGDHVTGNDIVGDIASILGEEYSRRRSSITDEQMSEVIIAIAKHWGDHQEPPKKLNAFIGKNINPPGIARALVRELKSAAGEKELGEKDMMPVYDVNPSFVAGRDVDIERVAEEIEPWKDAVGPENTPKVVNFLARRWVKDNKAPTGEDVFNVASMYIWDEKPKPDSEGRPVDPETRIAVVLELDKKLIIATDEELNAVAGELGRKKEELDLVDAEMNDIIVNVVQKWEDKLEAPDSSDVALILVPYIGENPGVGENESYDGELVKLRIELETNLETNGMGKAEIAQLKAETKKIAKVLDANKEAVGSKDNMSHLIENIAEDWNKKGGPRENPEEYVRMHTMNKNPAEVAPLEVDEVSEAHKTVADTSGPAVKPGKVVENKKASGKFEGAAPTEDAKRVEGAYTGDTPALAARAEWGRYDEFLKNTNRTDTKTMFAEFLKEGEEEGRIDAELRKKMLANYEGPGGNREETPDMDFTAEPETEVAEQAEEEKKDPLSEALERNGVDLDSFKDKYREAKKSYDATDEDDRENILLRHAVVVDITKEGYDSLKAVEGKMKDVPPGVYAAYKERLERVKKTYESSIDKYKQNLEISRKKNFDPEKLAQYEAKVAMWEGKPTHEDVVDRFAHFRTKNIGLTQVDVDEAGGEAEEKAEVAVSKPVEEVEPEKIAEAASEEEGVEEPAENVVGAAGEEEIKPDFDFDFTEEEAPEEPPKTLVAALDEKKSDSGNAPTPPKTASDSKTNLLEQIKAGTSKATEYTAPKVGGKKTDVDVDALASTEDVETGLEKRKGQKTGGGAVRVAGADANVKVKEGPGERKASGPVASGPVRVKRKGPETAKARDKVEVGEGDIDDILRTWATNDIKNLRAEYQSKLLLEEKRLAKLKIKLKDADAEQIKGAKAKIAGYQDILKKIRFKLRGR